MAAVRGGLRQLRQAGGRWRAAVLHFEQFDLLAQLAEVRDGHTHLGFVRRFDELGDDNRGQDGHDDHHDERHAAVGTTSP